MPSSPGLLQIREYALLVFEMADVNDQRDLTARVEGRTRRQVVLLDQSKQFTILIAEAALRWRPGFIASQTEQLSVALYLREFDRLCAGAACDETAHALIDRIIADLDVEET